MPFLIPFIPVIIALAAYGAGYITLTALIITAATAALSFAAQMLLKPSSSSAAAPQLSGAGIDNKTTVRQATAARKIGIGEFRTGGIWAFLKVTDQNQYLRGACLFVGHECESIEEIWLNDVVSPIDEAGEVYDGKYNGGAYFAKHLGSADQAADPMLMNYAPGQWTENHRLRGITYLASSLYWDNSGTGVRGANLWSGGGLPNITIIGKGLNSIYDPRTGETGYTKNSALVVAWYICDKIYGLGADYATRINEEALIAAANACDEMVERAEGEPEKRYETDGNISSDGKPDEILGRLLGAMAGRAIYDGDRWTILAGVWQEPTITLTDDDTAAMSKIQTLTSARDSFNGSKGTYISREDNWQAADFPAVVSEEFKAQDNGVERLKDIELPFTISPSRAQRIAKIDLLLARQEIVENFIGKLSCWRVRTGDTIMRTSARYGWDAKPFYVASSAFGVEDDEGGNPVVIIRLVLQETTPTAYEWTTDEESPVDPAPNTNFPDVFNVLAPSNLRASERMYFDREGGGVKAMFTLSYDPSPDAFVRTGGFYRGRFRSEGDAAWTTLPDTKETHMDALDVSEGTYFSEVWAVNWAGNPSAALALKFEVRALADPPAMVTNFAVSAHDSIAIASFDISPDLDVREGGAFVFKHSPLTAGATWAEALILDDDVPGNTTRWVLPLIAGTYFIKARDTSLNYSAVAASFVQFQSSVNTFVPLDSTIQDPDFLGDKVGTVLSGGFLQLDAAGSFDDVADTDALEEWDFLGGLVASGYYDYDDVLDLGAVTKCRLTNVCLAGIVNVFDDFDTREADSDSWASWDGDVDGSEADSWLTVSWTLDDPSGSPVWSEYERLHSSSFEARAFRFRRVLVSYDPSFTPAISEDAVYAEGL